MAPRGETRKRVRATAADLFRRHGYHGTGVSRILKASGAPAGSLYFHFPGGKEELAVEAVLDAGGEIGRGIEYLLESVEQPAEAVARVTEYLAADLRESDYHSGCPVGTVATDVATASEPIRIACRKIFDDWTAKIAARLERAGWRPADARDEALVVVALIEGALLLARARRDDAPLNAVASHVRATLGEPRG